MVISREGPTRAGRAGRRWAIKGLHKALLGTAGLGLLSLVGLRWALQRQIPAHLLQGELEKSLGYPIHYQGFHLSWDGRLVLDKVELLDPEQKPFLKMDRAQLDFDRNRALHGDFVLQRLLLEQPDLELSGKRWKLLAGKPKGPSKARAFPLVLQSLDMRWLDEKGQVAWQIQDWQGSFPPVGAGEWKLGLQGPHQEVVEASGASGKTTLKLDKFPVARLATVATGAAYPNLGEKDQVDLTAQLVDGAWHVESQLRSSPFTGPLTLDLQPGRKGRLASPGGVLTGLGAVEKIGLDFAPTGAGWKVGPGQLRWRGGDWKMTGQIEGEDRFSGQLVCAAFPLAWPPAKKADLSVDVRGSAERQQADFELRAAAAPWSLQARGTLLREGLPKVSWRVTGPQGSWPGQLAWNAKNGDLRIDFEPLEVSRFLPGWKGRLDGKVVRQGADNWDLHLSMPLLSGPSTQVKALQVDLDRKGWSGGATWNGSPLVLSGAPAEPVVRAQIKVKEPDLNGSLDLKLALVKSRLRLEAEKQQLSWRGTRLPEVKGALVGERSGWKSEGLEVALSGFRLPLEATGGWTPSSWKVSGQLKAQSLTTLAAAVGSKVSGVSGKASGRLQASLAGAEFSGEVQQLKQGEQDLGNWKVTARKATGKKAEVRLSNPALTVPQVGKVQAQVDWQEGKSRPQVSLTAPALNVAGLKLGKARVALQWDPAGASQVEGEFGGVSLNGWVDSKKKTLALQGKLAGFKLAGLPGLPPGTSGSLQGQWRAQGPWTGPVVEVSGQALGLKVLGSMLGDLTVHASHQGEESHLTVGPILVQQVDALAAKLPALKGRLTAELVKKGSSAPALSATLQDVFLNDRVVPDASLKGTVGATGLSDAQLSWQVNPPLVLRGQIGLLTQLSGELQGQSLEAITAGKLPLQGQAFGKFTYGSGLVFDGELRNLAVSGQKFGQGKLTLAFQDKLHVEGSGFEAAGVGLLQQRYPGLQGQLSFQCDGQPSNQQGGLKLRGGSWRGKAFPDVTVEGKGDGNSWLLSKVQLGLNPPLNAYGRMWPATNRMELRGRLEGQSLADLALLSGGQAPPDLAARLYGDFGLTAQQQQVGLQYGGQVRDMLYRGVGLGNGQLELKADPGLDGQLELAQPMEISRLAEVPAGLKQVLPAAGILGAIRLRGVKLGGTLDNPSVSPLWAAPQLRLPFP
ncbi:hypothetical protein ABS71_17030 [bacterium SCN 62-11]|nr:hypothetical protein [Candidatus Eremiobacteraeota bacterium]ODT61048.1 MAG: hypothetical protein ABS71_17030 [bacterium SCN 62-11]